MSYADDYKKYRGKCKEFAEQAIKDDPSLTLVRGFYWCPITNRKEMHWWTKHQDGTIYDPTVAQFLSGGIGEYEEFDGFYECYHCNQKVHESKARHFGTRVFCGENCIRDCFGLD